MRGAVMAGGVVLLAGCAGGTQLTTYILPPHRLEAPVCPAMVLVHDTPDEMPAGGRLIARIRIAGSGARRTSTKLRKRLQLEAAKLGATRVLAAEMVTPSMLEQIAYRVAEGAPMDERVRLRQEALAKPAQTETRLPTVVPTDPSFYGRGLAYAIYLPDDSLRIPLECPDPRSR